MTEQRLTESEKSAFDRSTGSIAPSPTDGRFNSPHAAASLPTTETPQQQYQLLAARNAALRNRLRLAEEGVRDSESSADRLREQFAHQIGSELIAASRSVPALFRLPVALRRTYGEYRAAVSAMAIGAREGGVAAVRQAADAAGQEISIERRLQALQIENTALLDRASSLEWAAVRSNDAADQIRGQLAYRIGHEIIDARTPGAVLRLPLALYRAYRRFKKDRQPKGKGKGRGLGIVGHLDVKLWGGYARYACMELQQCIDNPDLRERQRSAAAHSLARWYYVEGEFDRAAQLMSRSIELSRDGLSEKRLCQLLCLIKAGRPHEALALLSETTPPSDREIDFAIVRAEILRRKAQRDGAALADADRIYLEELNRAMAPSGMAPVALADPHAPLSIWNIVSHPRPSTAVQDGKVSIIIPAYNAEKTLGMVLESLAAQSWRNIEVIVVDDCSSDGTCDLVRRHAADDPRVRLIRRTVNGGSYPARNDGVEAATGDFITVCDSDDWSHPEKIERLMAALSDRPECVAVISHWLRVQDDLGLVGPWVPKQSLLDLNLSSLLVRREVFDRLRGWDEVRVTGDAEFRARILAAYGGASICKVKHNNILSLSLVREDSLTRSAATHLRSLHFGVRSQYRDSYRNWHNSLRSGGDPSLPRDNGRYTVPLGNRRSRDVERDFDIIFVSDFALKGGAFVSTLTYMKAAALAGLKVAAVHWRKYELPSDSALNPLFYEACLKHGVEILTHGDTATCRHVIVGYPAILQHLQDRFPQVAADNVIVLINQFATRLIDGSDRQYDPSVVRRHLIELFGMPGTWIPISHWVKRLMQEDETYPAPHDEPWHPMVDTDRWCRTPIRWRGNEHRRAIIGRHGRDAYTKWPASLAALKAAYCVDTDIDVRFLGGAKHAIGLMGYRPQNWDVQFFNATPVDEFLAELDFLIHFPHELYIEEFGRTVMEAMAMGKVAILPQQFRETFGDAAVYCEPEEVAATVRRLWGDEAAYLAQAAKGREFVLRYCSQNHFIGRLDRVAASAQASSAPTP